MSVRYKLERDATVNDSSKTFVVPAGQVWIVTHINAKLVATATVGNRRLRVRATDGSDNELSISEAGATFPASQTETADFYPGAPDQTTEVADTLKVAMPILILLPGHKLIVEDGAAIDAAADDLTVAFIYSIRTP